MKGRSGVNQDNNGFYGEPPRAEHARQEGHVPYTANAVILQRLDFEACDSDTFDYAWRTRLENSRIS